MNRLVACAIGTVFLSLAGCSQATNPGGARSAGDTKIVIANPDNSGIIVLGRGETKAPPDTGYFDVGVEVEAASVSQAREDAARAAQRLMASLAKNGVDKKDIQTSSLSVTPRWDYSEKKQRIIGYSVSTSVTVKVRKLDAIGQIADDAVLAGGNATRVTGLRFGFEDPNKLKDLARGEAMADAQRKAAELARLGGIALSAPQSVEEIEVTAVNPPPMPMEARAEMARMPIERGTGTVAVQLRVRFGIKS